jgi:sugar lactone lactonase YvrE
VIDTAELTVVSQHRAILGEGPLWHSGRESLFWVDINSRQLLEQRTSAVGAAHRLWQFDWPATALAADEHDRNLLWMATPRGLASLDVESGESCIEKPLLLAPGLRSNDGSVGPDGRFWFGTMQETPQSRVGKVYSIGRDGSCIEELEGIGIPNTFTWEQDGEKLLISDSMERRCYRYDHTHRCLELFLDFRDSGSTPDGGALDEEGNLWLALWDGFAVRCYSPRGQLLSEIALPVPRPTSCCFGGADGGTLFITTAREGLDHETLARYPLSGAVLSVATSTRGLPPAAY